MSVPESNIYIPGVVLPHTIVQFPLTITVHLGDPDDVDALNVTVPYLDYVKNVASSELYPTWPEEALRANIHAISSIALNRIFTEWYRGRGYNFDITNTTQYDQAYVHERGIFDTISNIANEIFDEAIVREGHIEPLFAEFCDGRISQCNGMYQWGSVDLANQGYDALAILKYYYGDDITIVPYPLAEEIVGTYPGTPLELGDSGISVFRMQHSLDRISDNYPGIPRVSIDGYFGESTLEAVTAFQNAFDLPVTGIVDSDTWNRIRRIYVAVARLGEVMTEGLLFLDLISLYSNVILEGDNRPVVKLLQFLLNIMGESNDTIPPVETTGYFGPETTESVLAFQRAMGLPPSGIVTQETWNVLNQNAYVTLSTTPVDDIYLPPINFLGITYKEGMGPEHPGILILEVMLSYIATKEPGVPSAEVDGVFDSATRNTVIAFQNLNQLEPTGEVNEDAWNRITEVYQNLRYTR